MKKVIWIVAILVIIMIGFFAASPLIIKQSNDSTDNKIDDSRARSIQAQLGPQLELYYLDNNTVPLKLSDLNSSSFSATDLSYIQYKYIDKNTADVCLVSEPTNCKRTVAR